VSKSIVAAEGLNYPELNNRPFLSGGRNYFLVANVADDGL
jgi:hypothetical protein